MAQAGSKREPSVLCKWRLVPRLQVAYFHLYSKQTLITKVWSGKPLLRGAHETLFGINSGESKPSRVAQNRRIFFETYSRRGTDDSSQALFSPVISRSSRSTSVAYTAQAHAQDIIKMI